MGKKAFIKVEKATKKRQEREKMEPLEKGKRKGDRRKRRRKDEKDSIKPEFTQEEYVVDQGDPSKYEIDLLALAESAALEAELAESTSGQGTSLSSSYASSFTSSSTNVFDMMTPMEAESNLCLLLAEIGLSRQRPPGLGSKCSCCTANTANTEGIASHWRDVISSTLDISQDFLQALVLMHQGGPCVSRSQLERHLTQLWQLFGQLASCDPIFNSLSGRDQSALLSQNTPTFVNYILLRYLHGPTGLEQLKWLLLCDLPDYMADILSVHVLPHGRLNDLLGFFKEEALAQWGQTSMYQRLCNGDAVTYI